MFGLGGGVDGSEPIFKRIVDEIRRLLLFPCCAIDEFGNRSLCCRWRVEGEVPRQQRRHGAYSSVPQLNNAGTQRWTLAITIDAEIQLAVCCVLCVATCLVTFGRSRWGVVRFSTGEVDSAVGMMCGRDLMSGTNQVEGFSEVALIDSLGSMEPPGPQGDEGWMRL